MNNKIKMFEDFVPVGFGADNSTSFGMNGRNIGTGYNMDAFVGPSLDETCNKVAEQAYAHEANDNPEHTKEGYVKEAKDLINKKIDEACESYGATNEAMVQVAGDKKPAGAKILASEIVNKLESSKMLKPGVNINAVKDAVQMIIMDTTF